MEENTITPAADNSAAENQSAADENSAADTTSDTAQTEKTFTQKELDDIVRNRLERARKDMPSKEELQAFHEWQDGQKIAEQKAAEDLAAANTAKEAAEKDKRALEIRVACLSKGVAPEYADDVIALAEKYAAEMYAAEKYADDNAAIDKAVDLVIAKYPAFCGRDPAPPAFGITTGVKTCSSSDGSSGSSGFIDIIKENQVKRK